MEFHDLTNMLTTKGNQRVIIRNTWANRRDSIILAYYNDR